MPRSGRRRASAIAYADGFVTATVLLHIAGIGSGSLAHRPTGAIAVRAAGIVTAMAGVAFLSARIA